MTLISTYTSILQILANIIGTKMNLLDDQIFIYQGFDQPKDLRMYISIVEIGNRNIASLRYTEQSSINQDIIINKLQTHKIALFSISIWNDAKNNPSSAAYNINNDTTVRKDDLPNILFSNYAIRAMDLYGMTMDITLKEFRNTSEPAGSSIINLVKWTATYQVSYSTTTIDNDIPYFDIYNNTGLIDY